jgi:FAD/FMN-containing dehydrogenase
MDIEEAALRELGSDLRGELLAPGDSGSERARRPFNAMHVDRPGVIVRCAGAADIVDAVNFAREHGIEVTVRGGGHSIAGLSSSDGGMVIDLSLMRGVDVDPEARLARVQAGAVWGDLDRETQLFGLVAPGGVVSETGVAGLTLGGGYGWVRRKYGLACDNLVSAQVVGADGEIRTASAEENPDLFWALRGGGGNFGIVSSFTFRLNPLGPIVAFAGVFYPVEDAAAVLRAYREYFVDAPDEVTSEADAITLPADPNLPEPIHDRACLLVGAVYAGDADVGMRVLQPLRELATPLVDISQPMSFRAVQSAFDPFFARGQLQAYWKSLYLPELADEALEVIVEKAQGRPSPLTLVNVSVMGGAIARVGAEDTAFGERSAPYLVAIMGNWSDPADNTDHIAWVREAWQELAKFGTGATYLNFGGRADEGMDAGVADAFGDKLRRLAEVKATYDPANFFRRNNNILPAREEAPVR